MRRFFLLVMIVLLPLRGWAGAVMSVEMSAQNLATFTVATSVHPAGLVLPLGGSDSARSENNATDCPEHAAMRLAAQSAGSDPVDPAENSNHCNTCVACQICHTVALTGVAPWKLAPSGAVGPVAMGSTCFASAALATGFKPPIS